MRKKGYYKKIRQFLLWVLLVFVVYCWKKPETYGTLAILYILFLGLNRYFSYLQAREEERERLGKKFIESRFHTEYMTEKRSLLKLEILFAAALFVIQFLLR